MALSVFSALSGLLPIMPEASSINSFVGDATKRHHFRSKAMSST